MLDFFEISGSLDMEEACEAARSITTANPNTCLFVRNLFDTF